MGFHIQFLMHTPPYPSTKAITYFFAAFLLSCLLASSSVKAHGQDNSHRAPTCTTLTAPAIICWNVHNLETEVSKKSI